MQLFPHQEQAKEFLLSKKKVILADSPRVGKTAPTAAAAAMHQPALIICPAIAKNVWKKAFQQFGINATVINGRAAAKGVCANGVVIINYDLLSQLEANYAWATVVIDECHRIKTPSAIRTKAALKIMKTAQRIYALSGTPIPNRPIEIWPILHGLGIYKGSWLNFAFRYAKAWQSPWGLDVSGASNLPELKEKMRPHVLRRTRADVFKEYQQPVVSLIELDLPVDKREKEFDADALVDNPGIVLALEGLSEIMREGGIKKVPLALDFIQSKRAEEPEEPLVVFCWHKDVARLLYEGLCDDGAVLVTGETSQKAKEAAIDDFQQGRRQIIIGNLSTLSEGVDLSRSSTVIFVETTWATSALEQASARIENITKLGQAPAIYILTTRNSLDHVVLTKVLKKVGVIDQIL